MTATNTRVARISQIALGAIWLIDGALQFQPVMFSRALVTDVILPNAAGQPGIVGSFITSIAQSIAPHVALFNAFAAALQVLIGLALIRGRMVKPALAVSFLWAAAIWFAGEGFGGLLGGTANPLTGAPGAALLYIVVGAMVWPRERERERERDGRLGGRLAWAVLWLGSAVLWLLPAGDGAGGHGELIAVVLAALSAAIGISALTRTAERTFLGLGVTLSVVFWVVGQGAGGILTGSATDVSTAPLVALIGCMLLEPLGVALFAVDAHPGPAKRRRKRARTCAHVWARIRSA